MRRIPAELLLLGVVLLWSFNFTAVRFGVTHGFSPLAYAPLRWAMAGLALAAIARRRGQSLRVVRRDLGILAAVSVVGILVNQAALAMHCTSPRRRRSPLCSERCRSSSPSSRS